MPWTKDAVSQAPKTIYMAPPEQFPMIRIIFDPNVENKWLIEYAYINSDQDTQAEVEALMGL